MRPGEAAVRARGLYILPLNVPPPSPPSSDPDVGEASCKVPVFPCGAATLRLCVQQIHKLLVQADALVVKMRTLIYLHHAQIYPLV